MQIPVTYSIPRRDVPMARLYPKYRLQPEWATTQSKLINTQFAHHFIAHAPVNRAIACLEGAIAPSTTD